LPEKKSVYRIVIHATNLEEFEIQAYDARGKWQKIYDRRTNKEQVIDIRLSKVVTTAGIKLVVRRTTEDAALRRKMCRSGVGLLMAGSGTRFFAA